MENAPNPCEPTPDAPVNPPANTDDFVGDFPKEDVPKDCCPEFPNIDAEDDRSGLSKERTKQIMPQRKSV